MIHQSGCFKLSVLITSTRTTTTINNLKKLTHPIFCVTREIYGTFINYVRHVVGQNLTMPRARNLYRGILVIIETVLSQTTPSCSY